MGLLDYRGCKAYGQALKACTKSPIDTDDSIAHRHTFLSMEQDLRNNQDIFYRSVKEAKTLVPLQRNGRRQP